MQHNGLKFSHQIWDGFEIFSNGYLGWRQTRHAFREMVDQGSHNEVTQQRVLDAASDLLFNC